MMDDFNSELNWSPESWFANRVKTEDDSKSWTDEDARILASHVPEYLRIERDAKNNGTWLKLPNGLTYDGDPRDWVMMQSEAFKKNYQNMPWYSGQSYYKNSALRKRYGNGTMWFSNSRPYANAFAYTYDRFGRGDRYTPIYDPNDKDFNPTWYYNTTDPEIQEEKAQMTGGHVFVAGIPKNGNYRDLHMPDNTWANWEHMPYSFVNGSIQYNPESVSVRQKSDLYNTISEYEARNYKKTLTDDVVDWSKQLGDLGIFLHRIDDGMSANPYKQGSFQTKDTWKNTNWRDYKFLDDGYTKLIDEFISQPGFTRYLKFINGNNGNFDINNSDKYSMNDRKSSDVSYAKKGVKLIPRKI